MKQSLYTAPFRKSIKMYMSNLSLTRLLFNQYMSVENENIVPLSRLDRPSNAGSSIDPSHVFFHARSCCPRTSETTPHDHGKTDISQPGFFKLGFSIHLPHLTSHSRGNNLGFLAVIDSPMDYTAYPTPWSTTSVAEPESARLYPIFQQVYLPRHTL